MISFELSEQQQQIKEMTHWFAKNEIRPISLESDRLEAIPEEWLDMVNQMGIHLNTSSFSGGDKEKASKGPKKERVGNRLGVLATEEMAWVDTAIALSLTRSCFGYLH